MLRRLTRGLRRVAAATLASVYGLCVLASAMALTISDHAWATHGPATLTEAAVHAAAPAQSRFHEHGADAHAGVPADHDHANTLDGDSSDQAPAHGNCCGLFCIPALGCETNFSVGPVGQRSLAAAFLTDDLVGRGPDRIIKPPISPSEPQ